MRKTPLTRFEKFAFELHYGRNPNTEICNLLNFDKLEKLTKRFVSAKPDFLQLSHQEQSNRRIGPRESDGRFIKSPSKQKRKLVIESDSRSETQLMDTESPKTPEPHHNTTLKKSTIGRGRPKLIRDRTSPNSTQTPTNTPMPGKSMGPLTITATNTTEIEVDRALEDAKRTDQEFFIQDDYGKAFTDN